MFFLYEIVVIYLRIHLLTMALKKYFKHFSNKDVCSFYAMYCIEFYLNLEKELGVRRNKAETRLLSWSQNDR